MNRPSEPVWDVWRGIPLALGAKIVMSWWFVFSSSSLDDSGGSLHMHLSQHVGLLLRIASRSLSILLCLEFLIMAWAKHLLFSCPCHSMFGIGRVITSGLTGERGACGTYLIISLLLLELQQAGSVLLFLLQQFSFPLDLPYGKIPFLASLAVADFL